MKILGLFTSFGEPVDGELIAGYLVFLSNYLSIYLGLPLDLSRHEILHGRTGALPKGDVHDEGPLLLLS